MSHFAYSLQFSFSIGWMRLPNHTRSFWAACSNELFAQAREISDIDLAKQSPFPKDFRISRSKWSWLEP